MKNKYLALFLIIYSVHLSGFGQTVPGKKATITSRLGKHTISGDWGELGAGTSVITGESHNTPRNHKYYFNVTQDNSSVRISLNSTNNTRGTIFSEFGQKITSIPSNRDYERRFPRAGKYFIILTADRFSTGTYRIEMSGAVNRIVEDKTDYWSQDNMSFSEDGAGDNITSPRNHKFVFEPEIDTYYDINISSKDGLPVDFTLIEPNGKPLKARSIHNTPGIRYLISKAEMKGDYTLYIGSTKSGSRGSYTIEILGHFAKQPRRIEYNFKAVKGTFATGETHEYTIPLKSSVPLEVLYRSASVSVDQWEIQDEYGKIISPENRNNQTPQYRNESYRIGSPGNYKLKIRGASKGDYELLLWGDFDKIERVQSTAASIPASQNGGSGVNAVKVEGQIQSGKSITDYSSIRVISEDYETGQKVAETSPDRTGRYILELDPGKKYSITVFSDGRYIASTETIDLTSGKPATPQAIVLLGSKDIGEKLTLNNIFFETGSPILLRQSFAELKRVAAFLKANPKLRIEIAGHTDAVGDAASNLTLSQNRANAVLYYLQDQLEDFSRLSARGYGKNQPIASNNTETGRQQNRRVEFKILGDN